MFSIPVLAALFAAKIALHIPGVPRYGYCRDDLEIPGRKFAAPLAEQWLEPRHLN
jgi:hypothetical protein